MSSSPWGRLLLVAVGGAVATAIWLAAARTTHGSTRWSRTNFRGRQLSLVAGLAAVVSLVVGVALLGTFAADVAPSSQSHLRRVAYAALIVGAASGLVGLVDDLVGDSSAKGFRGHLRQLRAGRVSSGLVKLVVIVAVAFLAAAVLAGGEPDAQLVVDAGVIAGSANLANLLDLRPGRALKVLLAVALPVTLLADPPVGIVAAWATGVATGLLAPDLRERGMLGDGGANALGGVVGVTLAAAGGLGVSVAVLVLLVIATGISEWVSFSRVIESTPPLRWLDGLGRRP